MVSDFELPIDPINAEEITVLDEFIGNGYGKETLESQSAVSLLATAEGVILDHTYTAKTFAAIIDWIKSRRLSRSDNVLFWHTGGQLSELYAPITVNGN
jgi:D-cysteine desulfhydrase